MTYQKCPVCDGSGNGIRELYCDTCNGHKIIHEVTGKPPEIKRLDGVNEFLDALKDTPIRNPENV